MAPRHVYVVVHTDQSPEQVAVQSAHAAAAAEAGLHFLSADDPVPSIVLLAVPDEPSLLCWHETVVAAGIRTRLFFEPDFGPLRAPRQDGHHSAFATEAIAGAARETFAPLKPLRFKNRLVR